jgi:hypothetical protein
MLPFPAANQSKPWIREIIANLIKRARSENAKSWLRRELLFLF